MTNGQVTKKIMTACKRASSDQEQNDALRVTVQRLLSSFPLSSTKLVYDRDAAKVDDDIWSLLIEECVKSDNDKMARQNNYLTSLGMKKSELTKSFGRSN